MTEQTGADELNEVGEPGARRPWRPGIRARVLIGYVTLLAAALAISVIVTRQALLARLDRDIDRAFTQEVEELRSLASGTDPATGEPFGDDAPAILRTFLSRSVPGDNEAFYSFVDGEPFFSSFQAPPDLIDDAALVAQWSTATAPVFDTNDTVLGEVRSLAVPLQSGDAARGTFVVVYFPGPEQASINQILRVLLIAGGIVLVASGALAWSLAGRVLRPVRELTATAQEISETDLTRRIPVEGTDELAELGLTFNEMLDRLQRGFDGQRQFLDDVAHELRTPITIAQGHLDLLGGDADEQAETITIVTEELERMNRYVTDLLLLAKSDRPDFLRVEPVDLAEFATTTLRSLSALGDRQWALDATPDPDAPLVLADPRRLSQAVLNLASNAVEHTTPGDRIGLGVEIVSGALPTARFWISDTGDGVDPTIARSLFDRHARGVTSRTARPEGMGIGLSIVDAVARAHRGRVDVDSRVGDGARFTISIPIRPNNSATRSQPEEPR